MRGPQRQENTEPAGPVDDRQKHRRRARLGELGQLRLLPTGSVVAYAGWRDPLEVSQT
jgi:hypothetical protein